MNPGLLTAFARPAAQQGPALAPKGQAVLPNSTPG